jgi:FixJ family two-component response regulator
MSGYSDMQLSERAQAVGIIDVLRKPLTRRDMAEPVARALTAGNYFKGEPPAMPGRQ